MGCITSGIPLQSPPLSCNDSKGRVNHHAHVQILATSDYILIIMAICCACAAGQGRASSSGHSSQHTVSETDAGSRLSTVVFPTGANSAASSSHSAALGAVGSGPISRLGQLSYAATHVEANNRAGQLPDALHGSKAGPSRNALDSGNRADVESNGPDSLAAISHAKNGRQGLSLISPQQGLGSNDETPGTSFESQVAAKVQPNPAAMSQPQSPETAVLTHAAAGSAAVEAPSQTWQGTSQDPGVQQQPQTGSAIVAQPPGCSNADSSKSASGIILCPVSSEGTQDQSGTASNAAADAANSSRHAAAALRHSATALEQQPQSQGLVVSPFQCSAPPALLEAGNAHAQGQPQAAPGLPAAAPAGSQAEQRQLEEQEVLYNMTGQTGSLMYMAPEVTIQLLKTMAS